MISDEYDLIIADQAEASGVPFAWIKAIIGAESDFNPDAYRPEPQINDGSYGLMQLLYKTARGLGYTGQSSGLYDPLINITLGAKLLAQLRRAYGDNFSRVYSAYNSGKPDLYLTSNAVAAHVNRAKSYLEQVEASITYVYPDDGGSAPEGGGAGLDMFAIVAIGALIVYYMFVKR